MIDPDLAHQQFGIHFHFPDLNIRNIPIDLDILDKSLFFLDNSLSYKRLRFIPGHSLVLQLSVILSAPLHSSPPFLALTFLFLDLTLDPPPQDWSHCSVFQLPHSQCTTESEV